jgi:preprotein translocase subunit SecE
MAVVTKGNEGKDPMADDDESSDSGRRSEKGQRDEPEDLEYESRERPATGGSTVGGGGFFSIYKPGQGYWTRMGTAAGSALVLAGISDFMFNQILQPMGLSRPTRAGIIAGFLAVCAVVLWRVLNKPSIVDFFIATESEMKKVNWTTRKELIGSTKVVIIFMFLIAGILFLYDLFFGELFHLIKVLEHGPFH